MVKIAEEVADEMKESHGIEIEIIDPRTLVPLDIGIIGDSIKKTSKLLVLEEGKTLDQAAAIRKITASTGERTELATDMMIMADPKPTNPRTSPATTTASTSQTTARNRFSKAK